MQTCKSGDVLNLRRPFVNDLIHQNYWLGGRGLGVGVAFEFAFALPVPVFALLFVFSFVFMFMFMFMFMFIFELVLAFAFERPLRLLVRGVAGAAGLVPVGVASLGFVTSVPVAAGTVVASRVRRVLRRLAVTPEVMNEQLCMAPGTLVSVSRSPCLIARMETIVGAVAG
ncbi:MAG: hypothetical protein ABR555_16925 [Pyrinomonadaceae bacterium]